MGSARRVLSEKRAFVMPLALLATGNLAAWAFGVYPLRTQLATTDARAAAARAELRASVQQEEQARATVAGKDRTGKDLERFYAEILPHDQSAARRVTYLRLAQLAQAANLRFDRRTFDQEHDLGSTLTRIKMTMTLAGSYQDIRQFIHALEASREFVVISNVALGARDEQSSIELTLQVATFFRTAHEQ